MVDISKSLLDTAHSVGLFWTCDRLVAETLRDNTQRSLETDIHATAGIRNHKPALERRETHALGRAATVIGKHLIITKYVQSTRRNFVPIY